MNKEKIMEFADECQISSVWGMQLAKFAKLVSEHEREECAKLCDEEASFGGSNGKKDAGASNCADSIRNRTKKIAGFEVVFNEQLPVTKFGFFIERRGENE